MAQPQLASEPAVDAEFNTLTSAFVDTMATFWIVDKRDKLHTITNPRPGFTINTANGAVPVEAVGIAIVYLLVGESWECYEVPNVFLLSTCDAVLYSTRVMKAAFGFAHHVDGGRIEVPGAPDIRVHDTEAAYVVPISFVPSGSPRPRGIHTPKRAPPIAALALGCAFPAGVAGTSQAILHQRLGFPYREQWRLVSSAMADHGLPPNATISNDLPVAVRDVIVVHVRGRARAIPFYRAAPSDTTQPPPGAVFYKLHGLCRPTNCQHLSPLHMLRMRCRRGLCVWLWSPLSIQPIT